jgi:endonuclease/exonuclease/phosphatase (EEP) superfamily protein YafD
MLALAWVAWVGLGVLALCALLGAVRMRGWPFELFLSVAPQQAFVCALCAWGLAALDLPLESAGAAAIAALNASTASTLFAPRTRPLQARQMRIVWANVWGKPEALARVFALAEREGADAVVIGEFPHPLSTARRRECERLFPHFAGGVLDPTINVSLFSRTPIARTEPIAVPSMPKRKGLEATLGDLRLFAIHPPVPYTPRMTSDRNAMLAEAFARAGNRAASLLVGDFNTVSWSPSLRETVAKTRARTVRWGVRSTWVTTLPVLGLPIDQAFAFGRAYASARLGPFTGSDHYPVIVDIAID